MEYNKLLETFVHRSRRIFGNKLLGIYLHGSMVMGCFNPKKSDIDLLIVVDKSLSNEEKSDFMENVIALNEKAPAKGIEMSIVLREHCASFLYPTPFELHFSSMHLDWYKSNSSDYIEKMKGVDPDLAAHFVITKNRGIILYGEAINEVFGEIPEEAYLDSIRQDISEAKTQLMDNPVYYILNLCRVDAFIRDHLILSKKEGGEWGLKNLDSKYQELIKEALACYSSEKEMSFSQTLALEFCEYMMKNIFNAK